MCDGHGHSIHVHAHRGRINRLLNQDFVEYLTVGKKSAKILKQNRKNFTLNSSVTTSTIRRFCLKLHLEGERGLEAVNE